MKLMIKHLISLILAAVLLLSFVGCAAEPVSEPQEPEKKILINDPGTLRFNEDGTFKIMIFTDLHSEKETNPDAMRALFDVENPDFVLLGGDLTSWEGYPDMVASIKAMTEPMVEYGIPWAYVYGNHDREGFDAKLEAMQYHSYELCIADDVEYLSGDETYWLPVLASDSDDTKFVIWCMDSHDYSGYNYETGEEGYDCVHADQVQWYKEESLMLERVYGKKINGLMYFHIPMQEVKLIYDNPEKYGLTGIVREDGVYCSPYNYGMFDAIKERGDVRISLCGHDHMNNFVGTVDDIILGYCGTIANCLNETDIKGTRVVVINENDTEHPLTYMKYLKDIGYEG